MLGLPGYMHTVHEFLGGQFCLQVCRLCCHVCLIYWVQDLYALEEKQEELNLFWATLLQEMVLALPLQLTHAQNVGCKLQISEGVDLLLMRIHAGGVAQTQEVLNVVVELYHMLHKLMTAHHVELLETIQYTESQIFCCILSET